MERAQKRILIFSLNYHPRFIGGAEIAIKEITDRVQDVEFHMVTLRFDLSLPKVEQIGNVLVHRIGFARKEPSIADLKAFPLHLNKHVYQLLAVWKALWLHRKYQYDATWAMMAHATGISAGLFKWLHPRTGYLLTLQEGDPPQQIERMMRPISRLFKNAFTSADELQTISSFLRAWGTRMGFRGEGQIVPNGVDVAAFSQQWTEEDLTHVREKLGKKPGDVFLVTTSRLVHKNAVDTVIAALAHLPEHIHFLIFGIGPLENALKAKAAALKLEDRVHFMGELTHEELPFALAACDIFVRPSRSEGMGNSFIEAMTAGLPAIATQEGGIADFLFDEKRNPTMDPTGWAVDTDAPVEIAAAVENILAHPEKTACTVENARRLASEKYDWNMVAQQMKELFEKVAALRTTPRVLIATPLYPPEPGGPATYTKLLEDGLPERGIQVSVAKFSAVLRYPKLLRHILYFLKVFKASRHADILMVQDTVSCGVPAAIAALFTRAPFIVRVPGDYAWEQGRQRFGVSVDLDAFQQQRFSAPVEVLRLLQRWVVKQADLVVVPSEYFASIVRQWGVAPERLKVVYHGLDENLEIAVPHEYPSRPFMVSAGRLVPWKGFGFLIGLLRELPEWHLVIVGDGLLRATLEEEAENAGVIERVIFTGAVSRDAVLGWCSAADAFVLNTSFESFSFQVLEAMAVGAPVITTRIGSIPELINDGREGTLLVPDDATGFAAAIRSTQQESGVWDTRRIAAKQHAQAFSKDRMLAQTADLLKALI